MHKPDSLVSDQQSLRDVRKWVEELREKVAKEYDLLPRNSEANEPLFALMTELEQQAASLGAADDTIQDMVNEGPDENAEHRKGFVANLGLKYGSAA